MEKEPDPDRHRDNGGSASVTAIPVLSTSVTSFCVHVPLNPMSATFYSDD